jgi:hypothetical protein
MRLIPAALLLLFAACTNPNKYTRRVEKLEDVPGSWITEGVILRAIGRDARIEYFDHVFLIREFDPFRGYIDPKQILLRGDTFEIRITRELFEVGYRDQPPMRWAMDDLPTDKMVVFNGRTVEYVALEPDKG